MRGNQKTADKLNYKIKLISGKNIVLVEAKGYEAEIFMPYICHGRIGFENIIPSRRSCHNTDTADISTKTLKSHRHSSMLNQKQETQYARKRLLTPLNATTKTNTEVPSNFSNAWRMSAGQEMLRQSESTLARNSIVSKMNVATENNKNTSRKTGLNMSNYNTQSVVASPQAPRWTPVPSPSEVIKDTLVKIPTGLKVIRLYRSPTTSTPNQVGRVVKANANKCSTPILERFSFHLPTTPRLSHCPTRRSTFAHSTQSSLEKSVGAPASVTKWRKCLTPIRTYCRRSAAAVQHRSPGCNAKKSTIRTNKVLPNFLANPTQGPKIAYVLDVRKRKLLVDAKIAISPHTFKQQQGGVNLKKCQAQTKLPMNCKQYAKSTESAFDMLTNSNRANAMSTKLNELFRMGCINKASSTHPKYKLLCTVPPLDNDSEARAIREKLQRDLDMSKAENIFEKRRSLIYAAFSEKSKHLPEIAATAQALQEGVLFDRSVQNPKLPAKTYVSGKGR